MNCKIVNLDSIDYRRSTSPVESSGTYFVLVASAHVYSVYNRAVKASI